VQPAYGGEICFNCGRPWGGGCACQVCGQMWGFPNGVIASSAGKRLVAHLLESMLVLVTCFIGWLIWALFTFANGQTPAKQLMGMRTVNIVTGTRAGWGRMFVREVLAKLLVGFFLGWLIVPYFWLLFDKNKQQLWDKVVDTGVVDDPHGLVGNQPRPTAPYVQQPQQQYQLPPSEQETQWGYPPRGGYGQQGGYGQYGGYGQQGGYGQPQYPPPPPPEPPQR